jgi:hypothetical protein
MRQFDEKLKLSKEKLDFDRQKQAESIELKKQQVDI